MEGFSKQCLHFSGCLLEALCRSAIRPPPLKCSASRTLQSYIHQPSPPLQSSNNAVPTPGNCQPLTCYSSTGTHDGAHRIVRMATDARPAQPKAILRGHKTPVQAAAFIRNNERLLTGDSDGFIVAWDLTIMRPRAVWQAHNGSILGIAGWGHDRIITHGRDNRLVVWRLTTHDEEVLSTTLPLDPAPESRPKPWMLHVLEISTMNFCAFSYCPALPENNPTTASDEILLAVPNTLSSESIDIFHLPSRIRKHTVDFSASSSPEPDKKNGMAMSLSIFHHPTNHHLTLIAGYERGLTAVYQLAPDSSTWKLSYQSNPHTQPLLSLDVSPDKSFFLSSGADAIIAKYPIPPSPATPIAENPIKVVNTRHAGQQSLRIRSDGLIFATSGWDSMVRVYSVKTMKELAVLKWHQQGCYAVAFATVNPPTASSPSSSSSSSSSRPQHPNSSEETLVPEEGKDSKEVIQVPKMVEMTVREKRIHHAKTAHWLAAGSKDGRVSLWDVY
ncbi:WD40-repeat-containing domain protein [Triangularia verruculosa]|uniref:ASTRA-associated protein 1 n=1 Tax=Triangularia verruculosa TaxID=2587418 RepID=A0AAN6XTD0_9PEZI|nr:WD40-repeat-containing domain protein [Triangularia verruculosa]